MSRRYVFICDGCDRKEEKASRDLPTYWADLSVSASGYTNWSSGGSKDQQFSCLLCGSCQLAISAKIDPRKWPRAEETR